jgi:hypothetical protein
MRTILLLITFLVPASALDSHALEEGRAAIDVKFKIKDGIVIITNAGDAVLKLEDAGAMFDNYLKDNSGVTNLIWFETGDDYTVDQLMALISQMPTRFYIIDVVVNKESKWHDLSEKFENEQKKKKNDSK